VSNDIVYGTDEQWSIAFPYSRELREGTDFKARRCLVVGLAGIYRIRNVDVYDEVKLVSKASEQWIHFWTKILPVSQLA